MLWERGAYFWAIAASLGLAFMGIVELTAVVTKPKPPEQFCKVAEAKLEQIEQCPIKSIVVHQGQRLGRWDGVTIEKN